MKKLLVLVAVLAVAAVAAAPAVAATKRIKVGDNYFVRAGSPPKVTVKKGTVVRWVWRGKVVHNVKVTRGPQRFQSPTKAKGSFKHRMRRKGTYRIVCTIHPGMAMTLRVR